MSQRRALEVADRSDGSSEISSGIRMDQMKTFAIEFLNHFVVGTEVAFGSNENDGHTRGMVLDFRKPLALDVLKRGRRYHGEADEENVGLRVRQRTQTVVVLLSRSVPEREIDGTSIDHDVGGIVVEDGGHVLAWEGIGGIADEQTGLADGSITNYDASTIPEQETTYTAEVK